MRRKILGLLAIVVVLSLALSACQPQAAATTEATKVTPATAAPVASQAPKPTEGPKDDWAKVDPTGQKITFWHNHSKARQDLLKSIVADFNATNKYKIVVSEEYQGAYPDIFNKMLPILNTADVPDLVVAYQNQAATYQLANALTDMTMVTSPKWGLTADEQKDFFPAFFNQDIFPNFGNARLGFPAYRSMEVMFVNTDYLKELGYDKVPTTPAEFKEMACKAAKTPFSKSKVAAKSIGYEIDLNDASSVAAWTFAFGGNIYDAKTAQFTYNSEGSAKAMSFLQDLFTNKCAVPVTETYGNQTDFGNGSALFTTGSTSGLPFYGTAVKGGSGHAWTVIALPHSGATPAMNIYGASISMPKTTPERELAAWLFLKYFTSPEVQAKWSAASGYFPVRASVAADMKDYFDKNPTFKTSFEMIQFGLFEPPVPGYDFVRLEVSKSVSAIMTSAADVKSTLDTLNTAANKILADQMAQLKK